MQNHIGELQQKTEGAKKREAGLEEEMMQSINIEKEFYDIRDQFSSAKAEMLVLDHELAEATKLYKEVFNLKRRIAELESELEITKLDRDMFKEDIQHLRNSQEEIQRRG